MPRFTSFKISTVNGTVLKPQTEQIPDGRYVPIFYLQIRGDKRYQRHGTARLIVFDLLVIEESPFPVRDRLLYPK